VRKADKGPIINGHLADKMRHIRWCVIQFKMFIYFYIIPTQFNSTYSVGSFVFQCADYVTLKKNLIRAAYLTFQVSRIRH